MDLPILKYILILSLDLQQPSLNIYICITSYIIYIYIYIYASHHILYICIYIYISIHIYIIYIYIYSYIYIYMHHIIYFIYIYMHALHHIYIHGVFNKFPDFFVQAFKTVVDSWKFSMFLLYILWDDSLIFMISGSNQQLQQELEYTLLKPECHSCWFSKMQSGREDTLEER